jgi:acetoin utilization deacetylase AcuC-like enzyme
LAGRGARGLFLDVPPAEAAKLKDPSRLATNRAQGMQRIGRRIGRAGLPTLIVQEGGYAIGNLRAGAHAFFTGVESAWHG